MRLTEVTGDLFTAPAEMPLAHCVSTDCALGAGVALVFRRRYAGLVSALREARPQVGQAVPYEAPDARTVWNLFTKTAAWSKPTYATLEAALRDLRRRLEERGVREIAMPRIASGLDRLEWTRVRALIEAVFEGADIDITVYVPGR